MLLHPSATSQRAEERGAVAVEFALLLPVLLALVLGIIQYGLYFYARQGGSDIARDMARRAAVGDPVTCAELRTRVGDSVRGLSASTGSVRVTRSYEKVDATATGIQVGDTVTVTVSFTGYDLQVPFVPVPRGGAVRTTAAVRVENVQTQPETCT